MRERLRVLQSIVVHKGLGSVDPIPTSDRWMNRIRYSSICVGMYRHAHGLVNSTLACIGVHVRALACMWRALACMWRACGVHLNLNVMLHPHLCTKSPHKQTS